MNGKRTSLDSSRKKVSKVRLINADALSERMYHDAFETDSDMQKWDGGCWIRYKMFENAIKDAPTVEERKRGKWIHDGCAFKGGIDWMHCSECGHKDQWDVVSRTPYCAWCGADMRQGGQDDG